MEKQIFIDGIETVYQLVMKVLLKIVKLDE